MTHPLPPQQEQHIRAEIAAGRTISAIKLYREFTGVGLKEAKDAVELMMPHAMSSPANSVPATVGIFAGNSGLSDAQLHQEVIDLVRAGRKIEAIKRYRQITHLGLKEAKDAVEALADGKSASPTRAKTRLELQADKQSRGGCLGVVVIAIGLAVTLCAVL